MKLYYWSCWQSVSWKVVFIFAFTWDLTRLMWRDPWTCSTDRLYLTLQRHGRKTVDWLPDPDRPVKQVIDFNHQSSDPLQSSDPRSISVCSQTQVRGPGRLQDKIFTYGSIWLDHFPEGYSNAAFRFSRLSLMMIDLNVGPESQWNLRSGSEKKLFFLIEFHGLNVFNLILCILWIVIWMRTTYGY